MSYAVPTQPAKSRPGVVQAAVYLMWAVVALNVIGILLSFVPTPELDRALDDFYAQHPELNTSAATTLGNIGSIVFSVAIAIAFAVLAIFVGRGSQPARITTWVIGGVLALCQGCGLLSSLAAPALLENVSAGGDPNAELAVEEARIILDNTPGWLTAVTSVMSILALLAILAVIILLAVPRANEYFRKEEEVWVPPTGSGGGYPQFPPPAIPQNPGAPPAPPSAQPPTPPTQS
jgi:hypothetical protein